MKVVDCDENSWFLLEEDGNFYFDASCNHSVVYFTYSIQLTDDELLQYERGGKKFLSELAGDMNFSAPIARGSKSKYIQQEVSKELSEKISDTIISWRKQIAST